MNTDAKEMVATIERMYSAFGLDDRVHLDEVLTHHLVGFCTRRTVWADRCANNGAAGVNNFAGHESDADDVGVAIFLAKTKTF